MATVVLCGLVFVVVPMAEQLAAGLGALAPVVFLALHASTVVIVPLPAWPLTAVNAVVYGGWAGFGLSMAGLVLGSVAAFFLGRRFGWQVLRRIRIFEKYADMVRGSDGLWLVPLLALPIPMAGDIGCFLAGLTKIRFRRLVVLVIVGRIPGNALGVLGTVGVATGSMAALITAVAGIMLLMLLNRYWQASKAQREDKEDMGKTTRTIVREPGYEPEQPRELPSLKRPVAFVFGAGGSHGAVQVGQLRALQEHGLRPDFMVGCSVGALNAALTAQDPEFADTKLDAMWRQVRASDLFCRSNQPLSQRRSLFVDDGLRRLAARHFAADSRFEDFSVPLYLIAGKGMTLRNQVLCQGPLLPAMLASCALPLLLPSVEINGTRLVDGGLRHALPIAEAFELGAASVVALPTTRWPRPIGYRASGPTDDSRVAILDGAFTPGTGWSFSRTDTLIERGYRAASAQLADWNTAPRNTVPELVAV